MLPNPALLMLDMQNDFLHPQGKRSSIFEEVQRRALISSSIDLMSFARKLQMPVIYSKVAYRRGYLDARLHFPVSEGVEVLLLDSWGSDVIQEVYPNPDDIVILKKRASAFFATDLDLVLRSLDRKTLIIVGVATNLAVDSTVRDGFFRGYDIVVVRECTLGTKPHLCEYSLENINNYFGKVMTLDQVKELSG